MSHRKVLSQGNVPFSWEEKPGVSKFWFPDFEALASLQSFDGREIPPPPCRLQPRPIRNASGKGTRWEEDPFLLAYKECTKSVKNGQFLQTGSKGAVAVVKKSKFFGFSCKSVDSCEIREDGFFNLRTYRIRTSTWK